MEENRKRKNKVLITKNVMKKIRKKYYNTEKNVMLYFIRKIM